VRDLLGVDTSAKLSLKEDPGRGVFVKDLSEEVVQDVTSINTVMDRGFNNRTVGATLVSSSSFSSSSSSLQFLKVLWIISTHFVSNITLQFN